MRAPHDVDGPRFGWREAGTGKVPLVLLHGLSGSRFAWEPQVSGLSDNWRVVAWDQPGYGSSKPFAAKTTFAGLADAVRDLIDTLGAPDAHLVGLSFGGMVAQYTALAHPDRVRSLSLLSTSPAFGLDGTTPDAWRNARLAPLDAGREPAEFAAEVLGAISGPNISAAAFEEQRVAMTRVPGTALRQTIDCLITHDSRSRLHEIEAPTLVLVGELDDETPVSYARHLADGIDGSDFKVIPGAGHLLNVEAPNVVNSLLRAHLQQAEA